MRYWVKLWTEMLDDPKMGRLTDRQHRLFTNLMCLAGIIDDDGRLLNTDDIAYKVRRDVGSVAEDLAALAAVNIVKQIDGAWHLINFGKRNERPPSAEPEAVKERVARYREKKRDGNEDVTPLHEMVTTPLRDVTPPDKIRSDQIRSETEQQQTTDTLAVVVGSLFGVLDARTVEQELGGWPHPEHAAAIVAYAKRQKDIKSVPAFVRAKLREGWKPPGNGKGQRKRSIDGAYAEYIQTGTEADRHRFIEGEYADIIQH